MYTFLMISWSLVQSIFGWLSFAFFKTGGLAKDDGAMYLILILVFCVAGGFVDKFFRGIKKNTIAVILLDAVFSPLRFPVQIVACIALRAKDIPLKRGFRGNGGKNFLKLPIFLLTSHEPTDRDVAGNEGGVLYAGYSADASGHSSITFSATENAPYREENVYRAMREIAFAACERKFRKICDTVRIKFNAKCEIQGRKIRFKLHYDAKGLDSLRSKADSEDAQLAITCAVDSKTDELFDNASRWFSSHPVNRDFELLQPYVDGESVS